MTEKPRKLKSYISWGEGWRGGETENSYNKWRFREETIGVWKNNGVPEGRMRNERLWRRNLNRPTGGGGLWNFFYGESPHQRVLWRTGSGLRTKRREETVRRHIYEVKLSPRDCSSTFLIHQVLHQKIFW